MTEIVFRVWHLKTKRMYYRGYQKLFFVLLCDDSEGKKDGKGNPVLRAGYDDCVMLQSTGLFDRNGREMFEGDILRIFWQGKTYEDVLDEVPDMWKSRKLHPLSGVFQKQGIQPDLESMEVEVIGNRFENE